MTGGFSLEKVASPGKGRAPPLPLQESNRPSKAPKVDGLVVVQEGPRPPPPRRLPHTGDIVVALYKYTDDASYLGGRQRVRSRFVAGPGAA